MSYGILWLSHLAGSILFVTLITALASRCKKSWLRKFWPILSACIVFLFVASLGIGGYYLLRANIQPKWLFWYELFETIIYVIVVIILLKQGLKGAASDSPTARQWPRAWLGFSFGMAILVYGVTLNIAETRIMAHLANIKSEVTSQIAYLLPVRLPHSLNAYPVYEEAAQTMGSQEALPDWFEESDELDFNVTSPEVHDFLLIHEDTLAKIRQAASMAGYSLETDMPHNFYNSPIPQYRNYRNFAHLLSLSARAMAKDGDFSGALLELDHIAKMAEHLRQYPIIISSMIAAALETTRYEVMEYVLAQESDPPPSLIALPIIASPSIRENIVRALRLEDQGHLQGLTLMAFSSNIFAKTTASESLLQPIAIQPTLPTIWWRVFILPSELKAAKGIITYWINQPAESYEALEKNIKAIDDAVKAGKMSILTGIGAPSYLRYISQTMRCDARRGLCDIALAVTAFKAINGQYPSTLEDLVPAYITQIPLDPFDNTPLKMELLKGGVNLYSGGPEQESDSEKSGGGIHFYLGQDPYKAYRLTPMQEQREGR